MNDADPLASRSRKFLSYVGFDESDRAALLALAPALAEGTTSIVDRFYTQVLAEPATRAILRDPQQVEALRLSMAEWLRTLLQGPWDERYFDSREAIGRRHVEVMLPQSFVPLAMFHLRQGLLGLAREHFAEDPGMRARAETALDKILQVEVALMTQSYVEHHGQQLRRSERLATLGQLAASVSHELRNPLGVINTSVLLLRRGADEEGRERHLERMERASRMAGGLADQLLSFARRRAPRRQRVSVQELLDDATRMLDTPGTATVRYHVEPPRATAEVDPDLLSRALANLIRNAAQAITAEEREGTVVVQATLGESELCIEILDDGPGLDPEQLERAQEPMYSTRPFGTGLGLPIARDIVEQHGGRFEIGNAAEGGVRVLIHLPTRAFGAGAS